MKVYEGNGPVIEQVSKKIPKKGTNENEFKSIMDQVTNEHDKKGPVHQYRNMEPIPNGIKMINSSEAVHKTEKMIGKMEITQELEKTLDFVDFYAGKLADSSVSASGMSPLIDHLETRMSSLRSMEAAPGLPDKLKPIISDLVLTLGTEIAKFKRGDYS